MSQLKCNEHARLCKPLQVHNNVTMPKHIHKSRIVKSKLPYLFLGWFSAFQCVFLSIKQIFELAHFCFFRMYITFDKRGRECCLHTEVRKFYNVIYLDELEMLIPLLISKHLTYFQPELRPLFRYIHTEIKYI